jgi:uncharacterized membrane protein
MKQNETGGKIKNKSRFSRHFYIMILCLLVGGFAITSFFIQLYTSVWDFEAFVSRSSFRPIDNFTNESIRQPFPQVSRQLLAFSPNSIITLITGVILIFAGISIWSITREKEMKMAKEHITKLLLLPEERSVIDELKKSGGQMAQSQIVIKTGMSKVKVHRAVKNLALKGIVKKYEYGLTNKIILEKDV